MYERTEDSKSALRFHEQRPGCFAVFFKAVPVFAENITELFRFLTARRL